MSLQLSLFTIRSLVPKERLSKYLLCAVMLLKVNTKKVTDYKIVAIKNPKICRHYIWSSNLFFLYYGATSE